MATSRPVEESFIQSTRFCLPSGRRCVAEFPPSLSDLQNRLSTEQRHQIRPPELSEDTDVSSDFNSLNLYQAEDRGLQQAIDAHVPQNAETRPINILPEQDSSPHMSRRHGNSACHASSVSDISSQYIYKGVQTYKYPQMADYRTRLWTFKNWPLLSPVKEDLAAANMFYEGVIIYDGEHIIDQVTCFKCGQTFRGWGRNDSPEEEHMIIYRDCFLTTWEEEL